MWEEMPGPGIKKDMNWQGEKSKGGSQKSNEL